PWEPRHDGNRSFPAIKYLDPEVPLGRLFYFFGNAFSFMCCILLISFGSDVMQSTDIVEGIKYLILGYSFGIYGFTFFFMTGMRRAYDIGFPFWVYPIFIVLILLSLFMNDTIFEFLMIGMYLFLLQPGRNNN
ncbi:hypothetical protein, partial [Veillonella dispar]|uniref:hypothetical protein n=1 Tax=Veillonella dispar TaxID=39778 RepID=UPI0026EA35D6